MHAVPNEDGLYATFRLSRSGFSIGEFSCRLDHDKAPVTVANFVGLAEGSRAWIDFQSGHATRKPFYDGITFHRVEPGFVIQGGSPAGDGSDGPGYTFPDEFHPDLRHDQAGILSMANSGLNSNGSQFFVTLDATPFLDDVHNVFGEVVEGLVVVQSVQVGDVIDEVVITRNGTAAMNFDPASQPLPTVQDAQPSFQWTGTTAELNFTLVENAAYRVFHSDTLGQWTLFPDSLLFTQPPVQNPLDVTSSTTGKPMKFFNVARIDYPDDLMTPASAVGKKLRINDDTGFVLELSISGSNSGTYTFTQGPQTLGPYNINNYNWIQEAYRARWVANIYNPGGLSFGDYPITNANISFVFTSSDGGYCKGSLIYSTGPGTTGSAAVAGSFTIVEL